MRIKLFDSELKVMEVLWRSGPLPAGRIAKTLKAETGWNRNTTYTVIKKCIEKGAVMRTEPNFICTAAVSKEQVQQQETQELIDKMYDGSEELFFAAFLSKRDLSGEQIDKLKELISNLK